MWLSVVSYRALQSTQRQKTERTVLGAEALQAVVIAAWAGWQDGRFDILGVVAQVRPGFAGVLCHGLVDILDFRRRIEVGHIGAERPEVGVLVVPYQLLPRFRRII